MKTIAEFKSSTENSETAEPVETGDALANRNTNDAPKGSGEKMEDAKTKVDVVRWINKAIADGSDAFALSTYEALKSAWGAGTGGNEANLATVKSHNESVTDLFGGVELTESAKEKASIMFEAAVSEKVAHRSSEIEATSEKKLEEAMESIEKHFAEKVNAFMDYVATEFMTKNAVGIENRLQSELAESFMAGFKVLLEKHYVEVPADKINIVDDLTAQVQSLNAKLNEHITSNVNLTKSVKTLKIAEALHKISEGLTVVEKGRLSDLTSTMTFESVEDFAHKAKVIVENTFHKGNPPVLTEDKLAGDRIEVPADNAPKNDIEAVARLMA